MLASLYNGNVHIWNSESQVLNLKSPKTTSKHGHQNILDKLHFAHVVLYYSSQFLFQFLQQLIKSFEVCDLPVRAARFVARKNWIVTGSVSVCTAVCQRKL